MILLALAILEIWCGLVLSLLVAVAWRAAWRSWDPAAAIWAFLVTPVPAVPLLAAWGMLQSL